jgi:hypothetical protein
MKRRVEVTLLQGMPAMSNSARQTNVKGSRAMNDKGVRTSAMLKLRQSDIAHWPRKTSNYLVAKVV